MPLKPLHISDPLELEVANALTEKGIAFVHESQGTGQRLDFYLPQFEIYMEVKRYHTPRIEQQMALQENVILIQGSKAVHAFLAMIPDVLDEVPANVGSVTGVTAEQATNDIPNAFADCRYTAEQVIEAGKVAAEVINEAQMYARGLVKNPGIHDKYEEMINNFEWTNQ